MNDIVESRTWDFILKGKRRWRHGDISIPLCFSTGFTSINTEPTVIPQHRRYHHLAGDSLAVPFPDLPDLRLSYQVVGLEFQARLRLLKPLLFPLCPATFRKNTVVFHVIREMGLKWDTEHG